jgi:starch phosphorylase
MSEHRDAKHVAYFSMEMALDSAMPTYSGGLGVLAGDTMRAAADAGLCMVGVTLLYNEGYFTQMLDVQGKQLERPVTWDPDEFLEPLDARVTVEIEGRDVAIRAWRYSITGVDGHRVHVYMLDTDLPENTDEDRELTSRLYAGDATHRLRQEMVLGPGGLAMLRELGYTDVATFHMNEGHSALLVFSLFQEERAADPSAEPAALMQRVRDRCVFTTHTPVPAGHDRFPREIVKGVLGGERLATLEKHNCLLDGQLNMTYLGLHCSRYINGVSMRHEQVTEDMFPGYPVDSVTNGVHAVTWVAPPFRELFDRHIPEWRKDNRYLRYAVGIHHTEILEAHQSAKRALMEEVRVRTGVTLDPGIMTISFARRATPYKRADMLLSDIDRLRKIANDAGPLQIIYAGKAHPKDEDGKKLISRIFQLGDQLRGDVRVVYIPDYAMRVAGHLVAGVELWVNTPSKPREASGTSGMKAALNGVPSLSVLDGWWIEGHIENVTGWSIGESWRGESDDEVEAESLFDKLEYVIVPMFYDRPDDFARLMRYCIAMNGSFFTAQRMLSQYVHNVYQIQAPLHASMNG